MWTIFQRRASWTSLLRLIDAPAHESRPSRLTTLLDVPSAGPAATVAQHALVPSSYDSGAAAIAWAISVSQMTTAW
jgi:hypothetical protein